MYKNWNKYCTKRLVSSLILVGSGFYWCTEGGATGIKARETLTRENLKKQPYKEIKVEGGNLRYYGNLEHKWGKHDGSFVG
jgi:hypothetical protein